MRHCCGRCLPWDAEAAAKQRRAYRGVLAWFAEVKKLIIFYFRGVSLKLNNSNPCYFRVR